MSPLPRPPPAELIRRYGEDAVSSHAASATFWGDDDGGVAYVDTGSSWVGIGAPLAVADKRLAVAQQFITAARAQGRRACFFGVEDATFAAGMNCLELGLQPMFAPADWQRIVGEHRSLREQLRRARAKGVSVRRVDASELRPGAPLRLAAEALITQWLGSRRMEPLGFVVDITPFRDLETHLHLAAEVDGRLVAFVSVAPIAARDGWLVEDMVRARDAPNGSAEALIAGVFTTVADTAVVTLGLAPLAGRALWQRFARVLSRPLYDFEGLRRFKARLHPPVWLPVFLVWPRGASSAIAMLDCLRAFASGSLIGFAGRTLARRPGAFPWALAVPLVPWTLVIFALALLRRAGPMGFTGLALFGWGVFDSVLIIGLFAAAYRPRRRLLRLLTCAAGLDALVSTVHVAQVGLGETLIAHVLRLAATVAPIVGTAVLAWSMRLVGRKPAH